MHFNNGHELMYNPISISCRYYQLLLLFLTGDAALLHQSALINVATAIKNFIT
jgi:hypothetical protein